MNILDRITSIFRRKLPQPPAPARPETVRSIREQEFEVTENGLKPQVQSLDQYYSAQEIQNEANEILGAMQFAESLKTEDQSSLDTDDRDGHVVLPQHGFESHPEIGHKLVKGRVHLTGNESKAQTTLVEDSWRAKNQLATWDKGNQTFVYRSEVEERPVPKFGKGPKHRVTSGEYEVSGDGTVALPQATNLEQADAQAADRENAKRANEILKSTNLWNSAGESLDNTNNDLDSRSGYIVAPQVQSGSEETVLAQTFTWGGEFGDEEMPFLGFDVEKTKNTLLVAGSNGLENVHGAKLIAEKADDSLHVILERPEVGTIEKVHWNINDGILNYEKLKKG